MSDMMDWFENYIPSCVSFNSHNVSVHVSKAIILCATKSKTEAQSRFICHPLSKGHSRKRQKTALEDQNTKGSQIFFITHSRG